jgi:hypothetical protein
VQEQSDNLVIKQHHEMIVMKPDNANRVTLVGRRLYSALIATAQVKMGGTVPLATTTFEAPLKDLLVTSGGSGEERTIAKKYFQEMQSLKVTWESTAPGDGVKWIGLNMLSQAKIYVRNGQTWLSWAFPPEIVEMIVNPERYAVWNLQVTAKLGTYAALALYEICARYRDNPGGLTSRKPTDWWIDALSNVAPSIDKKRREWRKFKVEKITSAVAEINEETDLEIELIEHKQGRAVAEVQFGIRKKKNKSPTLARPAPVDTVIVERATSLGVEEAQLESLIRSYGDLEVSLKLGDLEYRIRDRTKAPIGNSFAYLKVLLKTARMAQGGGEGTQGHQVSVVRNQLHSTINKVAETIPDLLITQAAGVITSEEAQRMPTTEAIRAEINALSDDDRKYWIAKAVETLKRQGMFSAIHQKRANENQVGSGLLAGTVLDIYGREHYGEEWERRYIKKGVST